ncbi:large-conductance mechanosensitive channel protein MscL [Oscillibacter sp. GMB15532]|uniref:large-conductance mechanosensitive channel protein MscL n=1 Tax=Oscillibacter sp. GMB15532 TaxID=3230022 RepID=UPI0034DF8DE2
MTKKAGGLIAEFKEFISRGNVVDMAVGVIIGGAFKAIADSLVGDILMPLISLLTKKVSFEDMVWVVGGGQTVIPYGNFLAAILNFLITALAIFLLVKAINRFRKKEEVAPPKPPATSPEAALLTEIRDLLKEQKK